MGNIMSMFRDSPRTVEPRIGDASSYHAGHPGLHATPTSILESEVSTNVTSPDPKDTDTIHIVKVDLNICNNTEAHHTNEYDITDALNEDNEANREVLIVRRGQRFDINITFNRPYDAKKDDIRLVFELGKKPNQGKRTHVEFVLSDKDVPKQWGGYLKSSTDNTINVVMMTPATCAVGKWKLKLDVVKKDDTGVKVYRFEQKDFIYILFNPWCKDDLVYMHDESLLKEYILNETGKIYSGNYRRISFKTWNFGQFSGNILDCCMYLLELGNVSDRQRGNPITIARKISAFVNQANDGGVLIGNWSGDYSGGSSPLSWTGSTEILEQYYKTKSPVKFGQCWVFSGIVTTVCRALGIPARSVTNFASAHDTDGSITIDVHFKDDKPLESLNNDSVWNFHVWNDAWMARPDLPTGYGGWQAIDATPQETSGGIYCMGPMSLAAIKNGDIDLPYDGPFVFAEVNADKLYWKFENDGTVNLMKKKRYSVGKCISSKRPNVKSAPWSRSGTDPDREDITDKYKFKEHSEEERAAVVKANMESTMKGIYEDTVKDVEIEVSCEDNTFVGEDIQVWLKIFNKSSARRTVSGTITLASMYYTGVHFKDITKLKFEDRVIEAGEDITEKLTADVGEYLSKSMDHFNYKTSAICFVTETKQNCADIEELRLRKPHLTIEAPEKGNVGTSFTAKVSFENPLPVALNKCEIRVEGPGLQRPAVYKQSNVGAKAMFEASFDMTPKKPGEREIVVNFNSTELTGINVSHGMFVSK